MHMRMRGWVARSAGSVCRTVLKGLFRQPATALPGRVALAVDPDVLVGLGSRPSEGTIVVCGTNGKTTTTNLLARAICTGGSKVSCNWAGANMESGVVTALLASRGCAWGVFECDELSAVHVVPKIKPRFFLLLNLFRDQLDRCGEIDRVQSVLCQALSASPSTTLVYNADDPLCRSVSLRVGAAGMQCVSFGLAKSLGLEPDGVLGGAFCQACGQPLSYDYRQYGQLGSYHCPSCGFSRGDLDFYADRVRLSDSGVSFEVLSGSGGRLDAVSSPTGGAYMVYNLLGAFAVAHLVGAPAGALQKSVDGYDPKNGRLQSFCIGGRDVMLNLAKNPVGLNQNIALLMRDPSPKAVYVVINDGYNDGRDVSWLWDVDFERLEGRDIVAYAGGHRANDVQVRLKYAGIQAGLVDSAAALMQEVSSLPADYRVWVLVNYSALRPVKEELGMLEAAR